MQCVWDTRRATPSEGYSAPSGGARMPVALLLGSLTALFVVATHLLGLGNRIGPGLAALGDRMIIASYAGAALLGVVNLTRIHARRVLLRRAGWGNSLLLLGGLLGFGAAVLAQGPSGTVPDWVFLHVLSPLYASMYGLVAFLLAISLGVRIAPSWPVPFGVRRLDHRWYWPEHLSPVQRLVAASSRPNAEWRWRVSSSFAHRWQRRR